MDGPEGSKAGGLVRRVEGADLAARLAERLGASVKDTTAFGEPVARGGITVIPVSKLSWAFGGGGGGEPEQQGSGGGGGSSVTPLGYIEIRGDGTEFKPLRDPRRELVSAVLVGGAVLALLVRALRA